MAYASRPSISGSSSSVCEMPIHYEESKALKSQFFVIVALAINGVAAVVIIGFSATTLFGPLGSAGFIASVAGGSTLALISISGIVVIALKYFRDQKAIAIVTTEDNSSSVSIVVDEDVDINTVSLDAFSEEEVLEATQYLGKRYELRLLCQQGKKPVSLLTVHAVLMRENQDASKGFLWKIELDGEVAHLYATSHLRMQSQNDSFDYSFDFAAYENTNEADDAYEEWLKKIYEKAEASLPQEVFEAFSTSGQIYFEANDEDRMKFQLKRQKQGLNNALKMSSSKGWDAMRFTFYGSEWLFSNAATYKFRNIFSLENPETTNECIDLLQKALRKEESYKKIKEEVNLENIDAWQFNNWEQCEKVRASMPESVREAINGSDNERNINFATRILEILRERKGNLPFLCLGAAHFSGETGVLKLLEQEGVKIEFVDLSLDSD